jgi:hypothetical protein
MNAAQARSPSMSCMQATCAIYAGRACHLQPAAALPAMTVMVQYHAGTGSVTVICQSV